jgi:predicted phage baseplate assembly protein
VIAVPAEFPTYSDSPVIMGLSASTVGGTAPAIHAEIVDVELLGMTEGVAGQQFRISRAPLLGGVATPSVEVSSDDGWQEWRPVSGFAWSGPTDQHYLLDEVAGTVSFGPAVRDVDGSVRQHGAVPAAGETVRIRRYATGGGRTGNVGKGTIRTLKSSIPFVDRVENLDFAKGGVDAETIDEAKARGPILLRTRSRAVTAEDYEAIVREIAPELARVRCVTAGEDDVQAGAVRVLVVPAASEEGGIKLGELVPDAGMLQRIAEHLDQVRLIGTRVLVEPPRYRGITVVTRLVARPRVDTARIRTDALAALYAYLNPISGGPDGTGWPFGRPVASGEIFGLLQRVRGVDMVEDVRLFGANPVTGVREGESQRIELDPCSLVFSYEHQVRVEQH